MARKGNEPPEDKGGNVSSVNVDNAIGVASGVRGSKQYASMSLKGARKALLNREVHMHYESDGDDDSGDFYGQITDVTKSGKGNLRAKIYGAEGSNWKEYNLTVSALDRGYTTYPSGERKYIRLGRKNQ